MSEQRTEEAPTGRGTHPVGEVLPAGRLAVFGFQHVLAMYAGAVAVPLILATAVGLSEEELVYLIIVAVSLAVGLIPVGFPTFYSAFPAGVQIVLNSGITAGSLAAIVLNIVFNVLGGREATPDPAAVATARTSGDTSGPV